jgi:hypothetical protein
LEEDEKAGGDDYYECAAERGDRYRAVNIENAPTVEFRFFRGALLPDTILASIGLVYNMIQLAISHNEEELRNLSFIDIVNFDNGTEFVKNYWNSRVAEKI